MTAHGRLTGRNLPINFSLEQDAKVQRNSPVIQRLGSWREVDHAQNDTLVVGETGCLARRRILPGLVVGSRELERLIEDGKVAFYLGLGSSASFA
jgi:hypothetical protein